MIRVLALAIAIAACGGSQQHADKLHDACVEVADHDVDLARANVATVFGANDNEHGPNSPFMKDLTAKMHELVQTRCILDRWSTEIRTCLLRATDVGSVQDCNVLFTPEQKQHMLDAAAPLMQHKSADAP